MALDHPQYMGCVAGLEDPLRLVTTCKDSPLDGFVMSVGMIQRLDPAISATKKLLLRVDVGGTRLSEYPLRYSTVLPRWTAIALGVDAVIAMLPLSESDEKIMGTVALAIQSFHSVSVPVILEVLPDPALRFSVPDQVITGARIAAELGADGVKVPYVEEFEKVVSCCPVPVLMAGGEKDLNILDVARKAIDAGAKGLVIGRNIFQAEDPIKLISDLEALLRP